MTKKTALRANKVSAAIPVHPSLQTCTPTLPHHYAGTPTLSPSLRTCAAGVAIPKDRSPRHSRLCPIAPSHTAPCLQQSRPYLYPRHSSPLFFTSSPSSLERSQLSRETRGSILRKLVFVKFAGVFNFLHDLTIHFHQ